MPPIEFTLPSHDEDALIILRQAVERLLQRTPQPPDQFHGTALDDGLERSGPGRVVQGRR